MKKLRLSRKVEKAECALLTVFRANYEGEIQERSREKSKEREKINM